MARLSGVADTLYIPLAARIYVSERFADFFFDEKALSLKVEMPYDQIAAQQSEYFAFAGVCRLMEVDAMVRAFIAEHGPCNIVNLGCGLETSCFRIGADPSQATFYEMDLPQVIEARRQALGEGPGEVLIAGDLFDLAWANGIDAGLPTLITAIGVLQYFDEGRVRAFIEGVKERFPGAELVFDAMTAKAIRHANDYIRKTGKGDASLGFWVDDPAAFAASCDCALIEARPFFGRARRELKRRLKLYTRIAMRVVDGGSRRGFLVRLRLP